MTVEGSGAEPAAGRPSSEQRDDPVEAAARANLPSQPSLTAQVPLPAAGSQGSTWGMPPASNSTPAGPSNAPPLGYQPATGYPQPGYTQPYWSPPPPPGYGYAVQAWPVAPVQLGPASSLIWADMTVRLGSLLIDGALMIGALLVVFLAEGVFGPRTLGTALAADIWLVLLVGYHPTCWWLFEASFGQRLLRLRVVRARDGRSLGVGRTVIRFLVWAVCTASVVPGIAALVANDDPRKQTWWDKAADSVVVRRV
jgi:uncharacterized RDD family membrane protein YckC